jgi:ParB/RepB/Spo0J family partition protein
MIDHSPYNSRLKYSATSIEEMANSMNSNGQLVTIKVRPSPVDNSRYELVFGHRRFLAAKKLGWKTIRAEVVNATNEDVLMQSLVENFEREGISDYEKALIFSTLNTKFNKTYEEIGKSLGISKQHVGSYISMLRLFDNTELVANPYLAEALHQVSEHHARVLSRVNDKKTRSDLLLMVARDKLSVRDLTNMISHLRSWFPTHESPAEHLEQLQVSNIESVGATSDVEDITRAVFDEFKLAQSGDFDGFKKLHLVGSGFTLFPSYPPFERVEDARAISREREWFYDILPKFSWKIEDLKITVLGRTALTTLRVNYFLGKKENSSSKRMVRGTMVFVKRGDSWKVLHEHWSRVQKSSSKFAKIASPKIRIAAHNHAD